MSDDPARDLYDLHQRMCAAPSGSGVSPWLHATENVSWPDLCEMHDTAQMQERALHGVIVDRLHAAGVETRGMLARALEHRMGVAWRVVGSRVEWTVDAWAPSDTYIDDIDTEAPAAQRVQVAGDVTVVLTTGDGLAVFETRLRCEPTETA